MDITEIAALATIMDFNSIQQAGSELNCDSDKIKEIIRSCESAYRFPLFFNFDDLIIPTAKAIMLHSKLKKILQNYNNIHDEVNVKSK